jgi:hypothetical protein
MDPAPREAFIAGHNIAYAATYFDQVLFAARLANLDKQEAKEHSNKMVQMLQHIAPNFANRLKHINLIAKEARLPERSLPALPPEFYPWANLIHKDFIELWKVTDPPGCLFAIGHTLGEVRNGLIILNLCVDFKQNLNLDSPMELERIPKRLEESIHRWTTADSVLNTHNVNQRASKLLAPIKGQLQTIFGLLKDPVKGWDLAPNLIQKILPLLAKAERDIIFDLPSVTDRY